jgi:hypothetical protein
MEQENVEILVNSKTSGHVNDLGETIYRMCEIDYSRFRPWRTATSKRRLPAKMRQSIIVDEQVLEFVIIRDIIFSWTVSGLHFIHTVKHEWTDVSMNGNSLRQKMPD